MHRPDFGDLVGVPVTPSTQKRAPIRDEIPDIAAVFLLDVAVEIIATLVYRPHQPQLIFEVPLEQPDIPLSLAITAAALFARPEPCVIGSRPLLLAVVVDPLPRPTAADTEAELGRAQNREGEEKEGDQHRRTEQEKEEPTTAASSAEPTSRC